MNTKLPTILVAFGATGDLMAKKIIPSIYFLHKEKLLPEDFRVIGFTRRDYSNKDFQNHVKDVLYKFDENIKKDDITDFLKLFSFISSHFDEEKGYKALVKELVDLKQS